MELPAFSVAQVQMRNLCELFEIARNQPTYKLGFIFDIIENEKQHAPNMAEMSECYLHLLSAMENLFRFIPSAEPALLKAARDSLQKFDMAYIETRALT